MTSDRQCGHIQRPENDQTQASNENKALSDFGSRLRSFKYVASPRGPSNDGRKKRSVTSEVEGGEASQASNKRKKHAKDIESVENPSKQLHTPERFPVKDRRIPAPTSTSPSPLKRKRVKSSGYAPPSQYSHLPHLTDVLAPNLLIMFIGLNPGVTTAEKGHAYAHPSNRFWPLLHTSGITPSRYPPSYDVEMPRLCACGFTNIVARPTSTQAQLSRAEMVAGTPVLEEKARRWKPEAVCIVGKGIWEAIFEYRYGRKPKKEEFKYGWQEEREKMGKPERDDERQYGWDGAWVFVAASTSGASASLRPEEKEAIWRPLGDWVQRRRQERAAEDDLKVQSTTEQLEND